MSTDVEREKLTDSAGGLGYRSTDDSSLGWVAKLMPKTTYTWIEWRALFIFCFCYFLSYSCYSLHAPFFPKEAVAKGASLTVAGFVFGVHQLTAFLMSLVYGSLMGKVQPKKLAIAGIFVMAISSICFGFLKEIDDAVVFMTFAFILRMIQASGSSAYVTSAFAIIGRKFSGTVPRAVSSMETASGIGMIVGPAVGGGLYAAGGFMMPFAVMGSIMLAAGFLASFYIPEATVTPILKDAEASQEKPRKMIDLIKISSVTTAMLGVFAGSTGFGFMLPSLEQFVSQNFGLPEAFTGVLFVLDGTTYSIASPIWGWVIQKYDRPRAISLIGSLCMLIGFALSGPLPIFPWTPNLWVTCVAHVIFEFGVAASFVTAFVLGHGDARAHGFPDTNGSSGLVSGMWSANLALGACTGAALGGFLVNNYGFQAATNYVVGVQTIVAFLTALSCLKYGSRVKLYSPL